jgi:hypothetical protein
LVSATVGTDRLGGGHLTGNPQQVGGKPPAMFDVFALGSNRLYVFTQYRGGQVGSAMLALREIVVVQVEEQANLLTVTFLTSSGGGTALSNSMEVSGDLIEFARSVADAAFEH